MPIDVIGSVTNTFTDKIQVATLVPLWPDKHCTLLVYDSSWLISSKTNQWSSFPPLYGTYTSTLSSMVLASRLTPTGARFDSSSYSFFNLFWYAIILMTSRITWSPCATCTVCSCTVSLCLCEASRHQKQSRHGGRRWNSHAWRRYEDCRLLYIINLVCHEWEWI